MNKHLLSVNFALILLFSLLTGGSIVAGPDMTPSGNTLSGTWVSLINEEYVRLTPTTYYRLYVHDGDRVERFGEILSADAAAGHFVYRLSREIKNGQQIEVDSERRYVTYRIDEPIFRHDSSKAGFPGEPLSSPVYYFRADDFLDIPPKAAADSTTPGWDLSYRSLLQHYDVGLEEWFSRWLMHATLNQRINAMRYYESPVSSLLENWDGEKIISSVLLEMPALHAAEVLTTWLVRTESELFLWEFTEGTPGTEKKTIDPGNYDGALPGLLSLIASEKLPRNADHPRPPGYFGVLSLYDRGTSKQIPINFNDIIACKTEECTERKPGRLFTTIYSIAEKKMFPEQQ